MIYFDRQSLAVLRYIHRSKDNGVSWGTLRTKFNPSCSVDFLVNLNIEQYIVTQDEFGKWINDDNFKHTSYNFKSFCTSKGNELIERIVFNFWKWTIPIFISILALVISVLSAIFT